MKTIKIYALVASDEPLQVRYVGQTVQKLGSRLWRHRFNFCNPGKMAWIREVEARGAQVVIRELSVHSCKQEAGHAEAKWILFWKCYCALFNINHGATVTS